MCDANELTNEGVHTAIVKQANHLHRLLTPEEYHRYPNKAELKKYLKGTGNTIVDQEDKEEEDEDLASSSSKRSQRRDEVC